MIRAATVTLARASFAQTSKVVSANVVSTATRSVACSRGVEQLWNSPSARFCSSKAAEEPKEEAKAADEGAVAEETPSELEIVTKERDELKDQVKESKDQILRAYAEMENVRTIAKKDVQNSKDFAVQKFAKQLLDVADNLARATESVPEEGRNEALNTLLEGVEMTQTGLIKTFESQGLKQFGEVGDKFDPNLHDAMYEYADPSKEAGTIGQVVKTGYTLKERVIRPAQVGFVKAA